MKISHHGYQRCRSHQPRRKNRTIKGKLSEERLSSPSLIKTWKQVVTISGMWTERMATRPQGLFWFFAPKSFMRHFVCESQLWPSASRRRTVRIKRRELRRGKMRSKISASLQGEASWRLQKLRRHHLYDQVKYQCLINETDFHFQLIRLTEPKYYLHKWLFVKHFFTFFHHYDYL